MKGEGSDVPPIPPEEKEYFRRIEERFCLLRRAAMLLSPRDWALIGKWWEAGIPLPVVLESLEEVFAARVRRGDPTEGVNSLAYVRPEVQRRWDLQREFQTARRDPAAESHRLHAEARRHLGRLARRLREVASSARERGWDDLSRAFLRIEAEVRALRPAPSAVEWDLARAESILESLDNEILAAARAALPPEDWSRLEAEAEAALQPRRVAMQASIFAESRNALENHLLRRRWGIPRLSLLAED